jgi:predicted nucleic acid-binding protein
MEYGLINMHYLDTGVFIEYFSSDLDDKHKKCATLINAAQTGSIKICTSALTLAEVVYLRKPKKEEHNDPEKFEIFVENFFKLPFIDIVEYDRQIAKITRQLVRKYKLNASIDAIHLASAIRMKADYFNSTDLKFINKFPERCVNLPDFGKSVLLQEPQLDGHTISLF